MKSKELKQIKRALKEALEPYAYKSVLTILQGTSKNNPYIDEIAHKIHEYLINSETTYTEDSLWAQEVKFIQAYRPHCINRVIEDNKFKELTFEFLEKDDVIRFKTVMGTIMIDEVEDPGKLWTGLKEESGDGVSRLYIRR